MLNTRLCQLVVMLLLLRTAAAAGGGTLFVYIAVGACERLLHVSGTAASLHYLWEAMSEL